MTDRASEQTGPSRQCLRFPTIPRQLAAALRRRVPQAPRTNRRRPCRRRPRDVPLRSPQTIPAANPRSRPAPRQRSSTTAADADPAVTRTGPGPAHATPSSPRAAASSRVRDAGPDRNSDLPPNTGDRDSSARVPRGDGIPATAAIGTAPARDSGQSRIRALRPHRAARCRYASARCASPDRGMRSRGFRVVP